MKKSAFTMLELIFVIVVIGILSAVFIPRFGQNKLSQAANQLISNIRYTQHLALLDDEYNASNQNWYYNRWGINLCSPQYKILRVNIPNSFALDPLTKKSMDGTGNGDLSQKYGVMISTNPADKCNIAFDHLGRPYGFTSTPVYPTPSPTDELSHQSIDINLTRGSDSLIIRVEPETGYVHLK